ncbi:hypothetical protein CEXT_60471 [Caerostris extrusa]|uniref:Uncharacterized protein n=1 Tax=Caerostris extrusa TaxID=172846 RepID=A0AAV4XIX2_CAEEX|nr:hypothetical protein CEXT_60471 [Caerostris extrusa]
MRECELPPPGRYFLLSYVLQEDTSHHTSVVIHKWYRGSASAQLPLVPIGSLGGSKPVSRRRSPMSDFVKMRSSVSRSEPPTHVSQLSAKTCRFFCQTSAGGFIDSNKSFLFKNAPRLAPSHSNKRRSFFPYPKYKNGKTRNRLSRKTKFESFTCDQPSS